MATYTAGSVVRISATFGISGVPTDPTTITLLVMEQQSYYNASTQTFVYGSSSMVRGGTGQYYYDFATTQSGNYTYRWVGTGTVVAAGEGSFAANSSFE